MSGATMIRLAPSAASVVETDVLDGRDDEHDPPSFAVLRAHLDGASVFLRQPATYDEALEVWSALMELSNGQDAEAESCRGLNSDPERKRFARAASKALATAASKVIAAARRENEIAALRVKCSCADGACMLCDDEGMVPA